MLFSQLLALVSLSLLLALVSYVVAITSNFVPQVVNVPAPTEGYHGGTCSAPHPTPPVAPPPTTGVKPLAKRTSLRDVHVSLALMEDFLRHVCCMQPPYV